MSGWYESTIPVTFFTLHVRADVFDCSIYKNTQAKCHSSTIITPPLGFRYSLLPILNYIEVKKA